ncbi:MAG: PEP/pyruvate-binding domain-containing protein [Mariniblastus sp.]
MDVKRDLIVLDESSQEIPNISIVGGKALNLHRLSQLGFEVPKFFTVSANVFRKLLLDNPGIQTKIQSLPSTVPEIRDEKLQSIRAAIANAGIGEVLENEIRRTHQDTFPDESLVAIRSSACDEDGTEFSFAGMHDSFLFVRGADEIIDHVIKVWQSAFSQRAISYRIENGIEIANIGVAVLVQQMIRPRSSGVVFTINPGNDKSNETVISSVWGAGEGLVSAGIPADTFIVKKQTFDVKSNVVEKLEQMTIDSGNQKGITTVPVPKSNQMKPSLSDLEVVSLAKIAAKIEIIFRRPQDIEFCFDYDGKLFILQTRPITRVKQYGPAAGNRLVWDNSNIIESYSGVTTPMTFSFIRRAYTIVYHCFADVMGIAPKKVKDSQNVFENMLGLIRGRVYYNLQNWYRLIRLFPGFQYNSQFMESMMGIKEPLILDDPLPKPTFWQKWFVELPALVRLLIRGTWNFCRIKPIVNRFESNFREHYDHWEALEFNQLPASEIKELYEEMEEALLWDWKAPIINDFYVMIYFGLLKKFSAKWCNDETGALQNDLICGEGGVESAEPAKMLLHLASVANQSDALKQAIFLDPLEEVPNRISSNVEFAQFNLKFNNYLQLYGFRCMNELKLEEFSLRDRPHLVYQVLRNYLSLDNPAALDIDAMHQREQKIRRDAETAAFSAFKGMGSLPRKWVFKRILRNARLGVKNRENMRFARTRIYGLLRELIRAIGKQLADEKILDQSEDVFYLTLDEVWDFIKGTAVTTRLNELAKLRRSEFEDFKNEPSPDSRFETFGFAYHKNSFLNQNTAPVELDDDQLKGTGCCPGTVTNSVRVLNNPSDNLALSGEILVAERTDPGWVPLYPAVSGILIERGSILSHSAVVAREMGIPTIVGISGLLEHVADGDTVAMNGASGVVQLIDVVQPNGNN